MTELSEEFPAYGWAGNKGYGAAGHLKALSEFGATVYHRRSWNLPEFQGKK
jgi:ribonuclease HII